MKRFARIFALIALALTAALCLTGCVNIGGANSQPEVTAPPLTAEQYTDYDAVYAHYNQVSFTDTLETLTERFGEPKAEEDENGITYTWIMEDGQGFLATFYETGELFAKVVYYEDVRQFRDICGAKNLASAEYLEDTNTFQECVEAFVGRPIEIAQISTESTGSSISRVYTWIDANNEIVQILFKADGTVESVSTSIAG